MAYNVCVSCDCCGEELLAEKNKTVSITQAKKIARLHGWKVTVEDGWYCTDCLWKITPQPDRPVREDA